MAGCSDSNNPQFNSSFVNYDTFPCICNTGWKKIKIQSNLQIRYIQSEGNSDKKLLAFKYMPAKRLLANLKNIVFVSPKKWRDPFETVFYDEEKLIGGKKYDVKAFCLAVNEFENEEGLWHFSPFSGLSIDNPTVRVSYDMKEVYNALEGYADKHNCTIYVGLVSYKSTKEIMSLDKNVGSIEDYICRLLLKRKAFSHEIELRIFIVRDVTDRTLPSNNNDDIVSEDHKNGILKVKTNNSIIAKVEMPPIDPMSNNHHLCPDCYQNLLLSSNQEIADKFMEQGIDVGYSRLYDIKYFCK